MKIKDIKGFFIALVIMMGVIISLLVLFYNPYKWVEKDEKWYCISQRDSTVKTGWINLHGFKYYSDNDGVMQTGWLKDNGSLYYFYKTGEMATDVLLNIEGNTYYFNDKGVMGTSWIKYKDYYHYFREDNGIMLTGWQDIGNAWYYLYSTGEMATGITKLGNNSYYFDDKGVMYTGWIKKEEAVKENKSSHTVYRWYYSSQDGNMKTFWQQIDGNWYYFYSNGEMAHDIMMGDYYLSSSGSWSENIPSNIASNNNTDDTNKPEVLYWKTIPVTVTEISSGLFSYKITVKSDEYNLTDTFTQYGGDSYVNIIKSGELKVGDTVNAELYSWKKGEDTITRRQLHQLK